MLHLSADSHWLTYEATENGKSQIFVVSFPQADQKRQVSTAGGVQPQWRPDGKGLYFLNPDGKMMSVDIIPEPTLSSGTPRPLFDTGIAALSFDSALSFSLPYAVPVTRIAKRLVLSTSKSLRSTPPAVMVRAVCLSVEK
jgi:hypothetical protein